MKKIILLFILLFSITSLSATTSIRPFNEDMNLFNFTTNLVYDTNTWMTNYSDVTDEMIIKKNGDKQKKKIKNDAYLSQFKFAEVDVVIPWANQNTKISRIIVATLNGNVPVYANMDDIPKNGSVNSKKSDYVWPGEDLYDNTYFNNCYINISPEWKNGNTELHYNITIRCKSNIDITTVPQKLTIVLQALVKTGDGYSK